ncbi:agenet domain-containing protein [Tanacetum coccineum]
MDPNSIIRRIFLREDNRISLNGGIESNGEWDTPEYQDITSCRENKEAKAFTFYRMETEEICERRLGSFTRQHRPFGNYRMIYSDEGPSSTLRKPLTQEEASCEAIAIEICERIAILEEARPVIKTLKYSDTYKKILDGILLDKLKIDGEIEFEEEDATKEVMRGYKALKEKDNLGAFVIPIRLEAKCNFNALADTGSNINVIPFHIYAKLGRDEVKLVNQGITMLNHSKAEPIGILKDVLCQMGVTTLITTFLILDMPVDEDVPIIVGRGFLSTSKVKKAKDDSDSSDDEDYCIKRDRMGAPTYGPKFSKYLNNNDLMDYALALQEALNPFRKICVWKKVVGFLGSLPVPLQHIKWIPDYSRNFCKKEDGDGKWHAEVRIIDPYGNIYV